jgi:hypothetical protein
MILMNWFRKPLGQAIWPMMGLLLTISCGPPVAQQDNGAAPSDPNQVPFHDASGSPQANSAGTPAEQNASPNIQAPFPFHDPQNLPAGTLLTVRLKNTISAQNPVVKRIFEAVLDEAVVVEGNKLVPRGATVIGRVESARSSAVGRNRGYVRLALDSIQFGDVSLPISTSSLFVPGEAGTTTVTQGDALHGGAPRLIHVEKGRRLTFRLTEPAYVAASQRTPVRP